MLYVLFFSLIFISTSIGHAMDATLCNPTILLSITKELCSIYSKKIPQFNKTISTLCQTNKALSTYYKNNAQNIVRIVSAGYKTSDEYAARWLGQKTILNKIKYLFSVIDHKETLTPDDLQDPWYLTATEGFLPHSLLRTAIKMSDIENVKILIGAITDINHGSNRYSLFYTAQSLYNNAPTNQYNNKNNKLFAIAQLLLEKNANPDDRPTCMERTPLMISFSGNHKKFTQLLLKHGANPYLLFFNWYLYNPRVPKLSMEESKKYLTNTVLGQYNKKKPWIYNAFECWNGDEMIQKAWFNEMIKDVEKNKQIIIAPAKK